MLDNFDKIMEEAGFNISDLSEIATGVRVKKKTNPFMEGFVINTTKKTTDSIAVSELTDAEGNKVGAELKVRTYVDEEKFVKVMASCFSSAFELGSAGQKMLWLLLDVVSNGFRKDVVYMTHKQTVTIGNKPIKLGRTTYYKGLNELKDAGFIAEAEGPGLYFINPAMIFNGDRIRFVQEWVKSNPDVRPSELPRINQYKPEERNPKLKRSITLDSEEEAS